MAQYKINLEEKEKHKFNKNTVKRLFSYLLNYKLHISVILVLVLISNILLVLIPAVSGQAIDIIEKTSGQDFDGVIRLCIIMAIMYIVSAVMSYFNSFIFNVVGQKVAFQLRKETFSKILDLSVKSLSKYQSGEVISRLTYDINLISTSITNDFVHIATVIVTVAGTVVMMLGTSPHLFLIYFIIVPVSLFFAKSRAKFVRPLYSARSRDIGDLCRYIDEKVTGTKTIRAYCAEEFYCEEFSQVNKQACDSQYKAEYHASVIFPFMNFFSNLSLAIISFVGILLYLSSILTLGNISTFVLYSRRFLGSVSEISNVFSEIQSALSASERVFAVLDEEIEEDKIDEIPEKISGDISIQNIDFGYSDEQLVLKNLTLDVKEGETVAIVGTTGSGKTTLISLLMRFYDVNSGKILINGIDITEIPRKHLRKNFSLVLQNSWIFNDTIKNNIAYGSLNATDEQIINAAKMAHVHDIIMALPRKYETVLNENAVNLSKGQKQLISIARCIMQNADMLILDEATSNVDTATEKRISDAMSNLRKNKTCFIIAHRLSTIQDADKIVVLKQGEVLEVGTHIELLKKNGEYSSIYNSQFN